MTLIWKTGYTTGVAKLDKQHQRMFESLNRLETLILQRVASGAEVETVIERLSEDTKRHFCDEERCMKRAKCPMAEKNEQEHAQFDMVHQKFVADYDKKPSLAVLKKYHQFAEEWVHSHVAFVDIHLRHSI